MRQQPCRFAAVVLVAALAACSGGSEAPKTVHVTYRFSGSATVPHASFTTATGIEQRVLVGATSVLDEQIGVDVPSGMRVTATIEVKHYMEDVRCQIIGSNGVVLSDNAASGVHSKATCEASAA